jgi:hypothetical protein
VPEVLVVTVNEGAAISAHILGVPATEVGIKESVRHAPQCLHRCLKTAAADVELDAAFVCRLVHLHGCDLTVQLGPPRVDFSESSVALLGHLGEPLGALLGHLDEPLGTLLFCLFQHATGLGQHTLHRHLQ